MDKIQNQRKTALETFEAQSIRKDPISWHLWKRAFYEGVRYQKGLFKNNSVSDHVNYSEMCNNITFSITQVKRMIYENRN